MLSAETDSILLRPRPGEPAQAASLPGSSPWWRLAGPLLVLAVEIAILTPLVEFSDGVPLAYLANARICAGLCFALLSFLLLSSGQVGPLFRFGVAPGRCLPRWLVIHAALYLVFVLFTLHLARAGLNVGFPRLAAAVWAVLALGVGGTSPRLLGG
jgi:hypothetical protein